MAADVQHLRRIYDNYLQHEKDAAHFGDTKMAKHYAAQATAAKNAYVTANNAARQAALPKPPGAPASTLSQTQNDAIALMTSTLNSWGLGSLVTDLRNLVIKGDTQPDTLSLALSQTDAYKTRFAGNAERMAKGLPELTPAQYIATEEQYRNTLQSYGLPSGFYDKPADFTKFIANDLSPAEIDARAKVAHDQYMAQPDDVKALWGQYFGTKGDAIAAILDPDVATSIIQDRATQVGIGAAAVQQGLTTNQARAQKFQQSGVTIAQARAAYQQIATAAPTDQAIAARFGTTFDQGQEENDLLLGDGAAGAKRKTLYSEESGLFSGKSGGASAEALGVSQSNY
jgi:hypothetical protein